MLGNPEVSKPTPTPLAPALNDSSKNSEIGSATTVSYITIAATDLGFVRLRERPDIESEELGQVPSGTTLAYDDVQYSWYHVTHEGVSGWVSGLYIVK
jgi:hypothetical protein